MPPKQLGGMMRFGDRVKAFYAYQRARKWVVPTLVGLVVTAFFAAAQLNHVQEIDGLGDLIFDQYQKSMPRDYNPDSPVRIIDIDQDSIEKIGQWPWPRTTIARLNDRLTEAGAAVIAYDVVFAEADRTSPENIIEVLRQNPRATTTFDDVKSLMSHDEILARSFSRSQVVAGFFLIGAKTDRHPGYRHGFAESGDPPYGAIANYGGAIPPLEILETGVSGEGSVSFQAQGDGIIRRAPLVARIEKRFFPTLSIEALRVAQGAGSIILKSSNASGELFSPTSKQTQMATIKVGAFEIPTTINGEINVYYTQPVPSRYIPAWKILDESIPLSEWSQWLEGQIVFIGTGADGLKDLVSTPIRASEPGVLVHAQIVEQVIDETYLAKPYWSGAIEFLAIIIFGLLLSLLLPRLGAAKGSILSLALANAALLSSIYAFRDHQFLLNPIYPLLTVLVAYVAITITSFYLTETERSRIRSAFSMYLSPLMVKKVSEDPSLLTLGGEDRELTILFLDVRSFSKISEGMDPQDITTFLNIFLTPMTDILQAHHATIDKYIGDAIVAFWNAPLDDAEHEQNAARGVLEMVDALRALNAKYQVQNEVKWPDEVKMGIGLNTGVCTVGNLGSEQRFSYSMIGDAANLASRIEGLTKQYRVTVMIGQRTALTLADFALLEADQIKVVGRATPERVFILAGDNMMAADESFKAFQDAHDVFLETYRAQDWGNATAMCAALKVQAAPLPDSDAYIGYYDMMAERIADFEMNPPPFEWDGVFIATGK